MSVINLVQLLPYRLLLFLGRTMICLGLSVCIVFLLRAISMMVFWHFVRVLSILLWSVGLRPPAGLLSSSMPVLDIMRAVRVSWAPLLLESIVVGPLMLLLSNRNDFRIWCVLGLGRLGVEECRPVSMSVRGLRALRLRVQQFISVLRLRAILLALGALMFVRTCRRAAPLVLPRFRTIMCELWLMVRLMLANILRELHECDSLSVTSGAPL